MIAPASLSNAFLVYVGFVAAIVAGILPRAFRGRATAIAVGFLAIWLIYAGAFSWFGLLGNPNLQPPGIALLTGPIFTILILIVMLPPGRQLAESLPVGLLIGFQVFRAVGELGIIGLYYQGLAPRLLVLPGGNIEILVGLSAPIVAWLATRGTIGRKIAFGWNVVGLLSFFNVVVRAVLSAPGPQNLIHTEVPNLAFVNFPYGLIPGFIAPLALTLHILAFQALSLTGRKPNMPTGLAA
jgi:hypothetical protein